MENKDVVSVVDAISELSIEETMKLGMQFKRFPLGCDLTEVVAGTCASDLELMDLIGNCRMADMIGAPIHICAYAFSDIAVSAVRWDWIFRVFWHCTMNMHIPAADSSHPWRLVPCLQINCPRPACSAAAANASARSRSKYPGCSQISLKSWADHREQEDFR